MATKKVVKDAEKAEKTPATAKKTATKKTKKETPVEETETTEKKTAAKKSAVKKSVSKAEKAAEPAAEKNKPVMIETHSEDSVAETVEDISIAQKLLSLYNLQQIMSQIDRIRVIRGELPDEIRDLEDAHEGMQTRINKYQ